MMSRRLEMLLLAGLLLVMSVGFTGAQLFPVAPHLSVVGIIGLKL